MTVDSHVVTLHRFHCNMYVRIMASLELSSSLPMHQVTTFPPLVSFLRELQPSHVMKTTILTIFRYVYVIIITIKSVNSMSMGALHGCKQKQSRNERATWTRGSREIHQDQSPCVDRWRPFR